MSFELEPFPNTTVRVPCGDGHRLEEYTPEQLGRAWSRGDIRTEIEYGRVVFYRR